MFGRDQLNCRKLEGLKFRATPPATPHGQADLEEGNKGSSPLHVQTDVKYAYEPRFCSTQIQTEAKSILNL
ncbi:hypothetical protein CDAR_389691 [Caerostris darwini]|uniref:Uncharacterized protein n=1 Tax=Caerostris darwini TaxID=1538125 RepID=A0AAV4P2K3_9ARAC|nr:hypothetical protein CDAR_389691 [Caerostris darwini]